MSQKNLVGHKPITNYILQKHLFEFGAILLWKSTEHQFLHKMNNLAGLFSASEFLER